MEHERKLTSSDAIDYLEESAPTVDYLDLFNTTGWNDAYCFSIKEIEQSIRNVWYSVSAYHGSQMVGTGSIISDGIHHALIVNMIVHPDFQNRGIGTKILDLLVTKCKKHRIRDIQLFAAENKFPFYRKYGFMPRPENAPGMELAM